MQPSAHDWTTAIAMGTSSPESTTELKFTSETHIEAPPGKHKEEDLIITSSYDELESLRAARKQNELKLKLLRQRYEEELALFSETRVEHILKNSGARDYFERLKDRTKIKEDIIKNLREDLDYKCKEVSELKDRFREIERQNQEYLRAWKEAQAARDRLEMERKAYTSQNQMSKERQRAYANQAINMSSTSSVVDSQVPPPPPIDAPSVEEIFRSTSSTRGVNPYNSLDKAIPPPPNIEVPIHEILQVGGEKSRAFEQEKGQFLCHMYLSIDSGQCQELLSDIVELVEAEQSRSTLEAYEGWTSLGNRVNVFDKNEFHLTLLRGHRAIHYHQIKPLVSAIEAQCRSLQSLNLCLDRLQVFYNNEQNKQFLCMTTQTSDGLSDFKTIKNALREVIDQFADRLTNEDETEDTVPHCSMMYREVQQVQDPEEVAKELKEMEALCSENLMEDPVCLVKVETIYLKIGKEIYNFKI